MRPFRRSSARLPVSLICLIMLVVPVLGTMMTPIPAAAQIGTIEVAVVDFRNTSKVPNDMFGTMATDAVVVELLRSGKFSVVTADALQSSMEEMGYRDKGNRTTRFALTPSMMVRLGEAVGAASVISGEILSINVDNAKKTAEVRLAARMLDTTSGEWVNGATVTGASYPRIGYTSDKDTDWIIEAVNNAARKAVEVMVSFIIPEATITGTIGTSDVLLNKGSRDGLHEGMEMIVLRRGPAGNEEVVGRVKVSQVTGTDARAKIIRASRGAQPEDRVRAVYQAPVNGADSDAGVPRTDNKQRIAKSNKILTTALVALGLIALLRPGGSSPETVPGAVAAAFANPAEFASSFDEGGIVLAWNTPKNVRHADIIEYHIWRDAHGVYAGVGSELLNVGPCRIPDQISAMPISGPLGNFNHHTIDDIANASLTFRYPSSDKSSLESGATTMPGITPGKAHNYWVSCVYRRVPAKSSDEGGEISYWETTPVYAGRATYFAQRPASVRPGAIGSGDYVDLSDVVFEWRGCRSADQYVIEVSPDVTFPRDKTWVSGPITNPTGQDGQIISKAFRNVLNQSAELRNVPEETILFWRVGAKNSQDKPGPYPAGPSPAREGAKNTRYIYSDPNDIFSFMTLGGVPGPPDGGDNGGGSGDPTLPPPPPN